MGKPDTKLLNAYFIESNDTRSLRHVADLSAESTGREWSVGELQRFLASDLRNYLLVVKNKAGAVVGFMLIHQMPEESRSKIVDLQVHPDFKDINFERSVLRVDDKFLPTDTKKVEMPKTPDFHLLLMLLGVSDKDVKLDLSALSDREDMRDRVANMATISEWAREKEPPKEELPDRYASRRDEKVYQYSHKHPARPVTLAKRIENARKMLCSATNMEWLVCRRVAGGQGKKDQYIPYDRKMQEQEGLLTSPEGLYFRTVGEVKNIREAQDSLSIRIGAFHVPNPDSIGNYPAVPATMTTQILDADLPPRLLEDHFKPRDKDLNRWGAIETSEYLQRKPYEGPQR